MSNKPHPARLIQYAKAHDLAIMEFLGGGTDGSVWKSDQHSAMKLFSMERTYETELACYQRLMEHGIRQICGLAVPRLHGQDDGLWIIEMGVVSPPCLLDFGKAYLDQWPTHTEETLQYHYEEQQELWGEHYPTVQTVLWKLKQIGILYCDPKPANIMLEDWDQIE